MTLIDNQPDYQPIDADRLLAALHDPATPTTVLTVTDADQGTYTERVLRPGQTLIQEQGVLPYPRDHYGQVTISEHKAILEAARGRATTANFPDVLRQGVQFDALTAYAGIPLIWRLLVGDETPSSQQQEEYLKDAGMGIAQIVPEGAEYPEAALDLGDGVVIANHKRGFKFPVTEEMRRFDQLGKVRDLAQQAGIALAITEEYAVIEVLTTSANYTRTADDNDEGNNTQTLTLSASALETALNVLLTMKDKNGVYLGVRPTIMFCAPKALNAAKRLIQSRTLVRAFGPSDTAEVDGTGELNPFFGMVDTIVSSPYIGQNYEWGLLDNTRGALKFQRVDPATVRGPVLDEATDTLWFYPRTWFGVGFKDDRFAFFSDSATRPTVS